MHGENIIKETVLSLYLYIFFKHEAFLSIKNTQFVQNQMKSHTKNICWKASKGKTLNQRI